MWEVPIVLYDPILVQQDHSPLMTANDQISSQNIDPNTQPDHPASQVLDLWQEVFLVELSGLTLRRLPRPALEALEAGALCGRTGDLGDEVCLDLEVLDGCRRVVIARQTRRCVQGGGSLPDAVEMSLWCLEPGQAGEVCCQDARFGNVELFQGLENHCLPLFFRVWLRSRVEVPTDQRSFASTLKHAKEALKQKRFLLGLLRLRSLQTTCETGSMGESSQEDFLRQLCICEHRLGLASAEVTANRLVQQHVSARHLMLRARLRVASKPAQALRDIEKALEMDPKRADPKLLQRARKELKRQQRTSRWFDGQDADERTLQASNPHACHQCNQVRQHGHVGESGSKMEGKYLCRDCWQCWLKIRRFQKLELDRQVEKATNSDYSTATDELPSLDDKPQDWDSRHPMWNRENPKRPDWQLDFAAKPKQSEGAATLSSRSGWLVLD